MSANKDLKITKFEGGTEQPPHEASPAQPRVVQQTRKRLWIISILILLILVIAGLVVGLVLGLKDDDDEPTLPLQCIEDSDALYESSAELDEYLDINGDDWMECERTGSKSVTCTIVEPAEDRARFRQICEDAGGITFLVDDAKLRCKGDIPGVGEVMMTMKLVRYTECFAKSCDISDDEDVEEAFLNYIGGQIVDEDEDIKECKHVD